eukprot:575101-Prymnesium_polylepis.1
MASGMNYVIGHVGQTQPTPKSWMAGSTHPLAVTAVMKMTVWMSILSTSTAASSCGAPTSYDSPFGASCDKCPQSS